MSNLLNLIPIPWRILITVVLFLGAVGAAGYVGYNQGNLAGKLAISTFVQMKDAEINVLKDRMIEISNQHVVQFVDRTNTIEKTNTVYRDAVNTQVPSQYALSNGWIYTHDQAAIQNPAPDVNKISDATPSDVKDNQALGTVLSNYSQCEKDRAQLHELIATIKDAQALVKTKNEKAK